LGFLGSLTLPWGGGGGGGSHDPTKDPMGTPQKTQWDATSQHLFLIFSK